MTLEERYDRNVIPTRETVNDKLQLRDQTRPEFADRWSAIGGGSGE